MSPYRERFIGGNGRFRAPLQPEAIFFTWSTNNCALSQLLTPVGEISDPLVHQVDLGSHYQTLIPSEPIALMTVASAPRNPDTVAAQGLLRACTWSRPNSDIFASVPSSHAVTKRYSSVRALAQAGSAVHIGLLSALAHRALPTRCSLPLASRQWCHRCRMPISFSAFQFAENLLPRAGPEGTPARR